MTPVSDNGRSTLRVRLSRQLRDLAPGRRLRLRLALDEIDDFAGGRAALTLLDAGSEEGMLCLDLARRHPGWLLVAADISEEPLRRGRRWADREGATIHYVRCDLQRPLADEAFDAVVALESLVEIPDDEAALTSLAAALRPGGLFVTHVPTDDWSPVLPGAERTWRREARHGYDAADLTARLEARGLAVREMTPTFRRTVALAQDVRDRLKHRGRLTQRLMLPVMAGAVSLERAGVTWGPPRGLFVVAVKR